MLETHELGLNPVTNFPRKMGDDKKGKRGALLQTNVKEPVEEKASCRLHRRSLNPYLINNNCCLKVWGHFLVTGPCSDPLSGSGYLVSF